MVGISELLGGQESKVVKFERLAKGKSLKERRKLEQTLLKPDKIKPYTGEKPGPQAKEPLLKSTIKFVFAKKEELALIKKHLPVSIHVEQSVSNHGLLIALIREVDEGRITYDKKTKLLTICSSRDETHTSEGNKRTLQDWRLSK